MLTQEDVEMIRQTRKEVYANRTESITLLYAGVLIKDDITGNEVFPPPTEFESVAVVTDISSVANTDRFIAEGIEIHKDDKLFHIDYSDLPIDDTTLKIRIPEVLNYDGNTYELLTSDKKGIGGPSRIECLGRERR